MRSLHSPICIDFGRNSFELSLKISVINHVMECMMQANLKQNHKISIQHYTQVVDKIHNF